MLLMNRGVCKMKTGDSLASWSDFARAAEANLYAFINQVYYFIFETRYPIATVHKLHLHMANCAIELRKKPDAAAGSMTKYVSQLMNTALERATDAAASLPDKQKEDKNAHAFAATWDKAFCSRSIFIHRPK